MTSASDPERRRRVGPRAPAVPGPAQQRIGTGAGLIEELEPIPDARVLFTSGGSEAIDSAIKLVRAGHKAGGEGGRSVFLSRHYAYHGVMLGGTSAAGLPANRDPYGTLLPDFFQVDRDSVDSMREAVAYHGPERKQEPASPWHGVPVFSAWVAQPEDATGDEADAAR